MRQIFFGVVAEGFEDIYFGKRERTREKKRCRRLQKREKDKNGKIKSVVKKRKFNFPVEKGPKRLLHLSKIIR